MKRWLERLGLASGPAGAAVPPEGPGVPMAADAAAQPEGPAVPFVAGAAVPPDGLRSRFMAGALWAVTGSALARGLVLLATLAAGWLLGADGYGQLGMIQSTVALFGTLAGVGLGVTATKHAAAHRLTAPDRSGRYIGVVLLTTLVAGSAMTVALVAAAEPLARVFFDEAGLAHAVRLSAGLVFFGAVVGGLAGGLLGVEAYRAHAVVTALRGGAGAVLSVGGMVVGGLEGGVIGLVAGEAVACVAAGVALRRACAARHVHIRYAGLHDEWPVLWRFSFPALLASILIMPVLFATNLMLARSDGGYAELGVFTVALKWNALVLFLPSALAMPQLPLLSSLYGAGERAQYQRALRAYVLVGLGVTVLPAALLALLAGWIMALHGPAFAAGGPVLVVIAAATLPMALNNILGQAIISADGIWWRLAADALLAVSLLAAGWALIPTRGALGLAVAYVIAFSVATVAMLAFARMRRPVTERVPAPAPYMVET